jgi:RHS repeat-associated protein
MLRSLRLLAALLGLFATPSHEVAAQHCPATCVLISPGDSTFNRNIAPPADTVVFVRIDWCADGTLNWATREITFNGSNVSGSFTHSTTGGNCGSASGGYSTGNLVLARTNQGANVLWGYIEQSGDDPWSGEATATYHHIWLGHTQPTVQVSVNPLAWTLERHTSTSGDTARFVIRNDGSRRASYRLTYSCSAGLTCSATNNFIIAINADTSYLWKVVFGTGGTPGENEYIRVKAQGAHLADTIRYEVAAADSATTDVWLRVRDPNGTAGLVLARRTDLVAPSQCVQIPAGPDGGYACGDLQLAHRIPAVTTRNQVRAPALVYNSEHARPTPIVAADLTIPTGVATPDSVVARLYVNGAQVGSTTTWDGDSFPAGKTRRIAVSFDGSGLTTGLHALKLVTRRHTGGGNVADSVMSRLAIVNRSSSAFGAGWWVGGLEQLIVVSDTTLLWIGGDGAARVFTSTSAAGPWFGAALARPDTIEKVSSGGVWFERRMPASAKVRFDSATGRHIQTVGRLGDTTYFRYHSSGRLLSIRVPKWPADSTYRFRYDGNQKLDSILAPGLSGSVRAINATVTSGDLTAITDPDGATVNLLYGTSGLAHRVIRRLNRLGDSTFYSWDAGNRLETARQPISVNLSAAIEQDFTAAESRGLIAFGNPHHPDSAYTLYDGPRTDVADHARFWLNSLGAPLRIRDAHGRESRLRYSTTHPALVDSLHSPTGQWSRAWYNSRGLPDSVHVAHLRSVGDSLSITAYTWDAALPSPTLIVSASGRDSLLAAYLSNGNVEWTQAGSDAQRRVAITYDTASGAGKGLYLFSSLPGVSGLDSVTYNSMGNAVRGVDRRGYATEIARDTLGRVTRVRVRHSASDPTLFRIDSTFYDVMDRVERQHSFGPGYDLDAGTADPSAAHVSDTIRLHVEHGYDAEGRLTSLARHGDPETLDPPEISTNYSYDAAGRRITETQAGTGGKVVTFDASGLVTREQIGSSVDIRYAYDAIGQLIQRSTPAISYPTKSCTSLVIGSCNFAFPMSTGGLLGLTIPGDTATFAYDRGGRLIRADNAHARVRRGWSPGGLLLADTAYIRTLRYEVTGSTVPTTDFSSHRYIIAYTYDLAGRLLTLAHPSQLLPSGASAAQQFSYRTGNGELLSVTDPFTHQYSLTYTLAGQVRTLRFPTGVLDSVSYDADGLLANRQVIFKTGQTPVLRDSLMRDPQGRVAGFWGKRFIDGAATQVQNSYTGLGALTSSVTLAPDREEYFVPDAHGNIRRSGRHGISLGQDVDEPAYRLHHLRTGARLDSISGLDTTTSNAYADVRHAPDGDGRLAYQTYVHVKADVGFNRWTQAAHYYDGLGRLARFERHVGNYSQASTTDDPEAVIERYRYDALGRRVLVHTNRVHACTVGGCDRAVRRMVWAGDQLLWEIRAKASDTGSAATVESDSPTGSGLGNAPNQFGRVGYIHAGGIDRPLGVMRVAGTSLLLRFYPHGGWRGLVEGASGADTARITNDVTWPGAAASAYLGAPAAGVEEWMGSLVLEQVDGSGLLYRRNRYYDPLSGQFTQPDPIGLAGGLNLYAYAGGDPVNGRDPLGLKVCFEGAHGAERQQLADEMADATLTRRQVLDEDGCVTSASGLPGAAKAASVYRRVAESSQVAYFGYGSLGGAGTGSGNDPSRPGHVLIDRNDTRFRYMIEDPRNEGTCTYRGSSRYRLGQILVHELGHIALAVVGADLAFVLEREYQSRMGLPLRPSFCH